MDEQDWLQLIGKTAQRDRAAFAELYSASCAKLYAIALRILHEPGLAEDALQEAFVQIWHRAEDYHGERGTVMGWLATIVRYRAIDLARRKRSDLPLDATREPVDPGSAPDVYAQEIDRAGELKECMQRLSASQQQSIALAFYEGLTHEQLATKVGASLGTVKSRIRRGLMRLRECLQT